MEFIVVGVVRSRLGVPVAGARVTAWDELVASNPVQLAAAETDGDGRYTVSFEAAPFYAAGRRGPRLVVDASSGDGTRARSRPVPVARAKEVIDLTLRASTRTTRFEDVDHRLGLARGEGAFEVTDLPAVAESLGLPAAEVRAFERARGATDDPAGQQVLFALALEGIVDAPFDGPGAPRARIEAALDDAAREGRISLHDSPEALANKTVDALVAGLLEAAPNKRPDLHRILDIALAPQRDLIIEILHDRFDFDGDDATYLVTSPLLSAVQRHRMRTIDALLTVTENQWDVVARLYESELHEIDEEAFRYSLESREGGEESPELAKVWADRLRALRPDAFIGHALDSTEIIADEKIRSHLRRHPIDDLFDVDLDAHAKAAQEDGLDEAAVERVVATAARVQVAAHLGRDVTTIRAILEDDTLADPTTIVRTDSKVFESAYAKTLGAEGAAAVHQRATSMVTMNAVLTAKAARALRAPSTRAWGATASSGAAPKPAIAVADECACAPERSVLSPAAYLADLLDFIEQAGLYTELVKRRPDIPLLELSPENTSRRLPAIDVAIEVLESAIAAATSIPAPPVVTTEGTEDERRRTPARVVEAVYQRLATEKFPFALPFDLWIEETRAFLVAAGTTRSELLVLTAGDPQVAHRSAAVAHDRLGLDATTAAILTASTLDEASFGASVGNLTPQLQSVATLLDRAELTFEELETLTACRFVTGTGAAATIDRKNSCDTARMTVSFTDVQLARLQRFVRLARRTGWSFRRLDRVLLSLRPGGVAFFDDAFLTEIALVDVVAERLDVDREFVASWWNSTGLDRYVYGASGSTSSLGELIASTDRSPYHRVFFDVRDAIPSTSGFSFDPSTFSGRTIDDVRQALRAVLGIDDDALDALCELELGGLPAATPLTAPGISRLHASNALRRALRLDALAYFTARTLYAAGPFDDAPTLLEFVEFVRALDELTLSPVDLREIVFASPERDSAFGDRRQSVAAGLQEQLGRIVDAPARGRALRDGLATHLGVDIEATDLLLDAVRTGAASDTARTILLGGSTPATVRLAALHRLDRIARLLVACRLGARAIRWWVRTPKAKALLERDEPTTASETRDAARAVMALFRMADLGKWSGSDAYAALLSKMSTVSEAAWWDELCRATRWPRAGLEALRSTLRDFDGTARPLTWPLGGERDLWMVARVCVEAVRLSTTPAVLVDFAPGRTPDPAMARSARTLARARAEVVDDSRPLIQARDTLRIRQRDALVAADLRQSGTKKVELFRRHLIDVDVTPAVDISRVLAATQALQAFVRRTLLGLEPGLALSPALAESWTWRGSYRVWEAARKLFLWPENWLDPALRKSRTPLFDVVERASRTRDLTNEDAEGAVFAYLEGLFDLANLEVMTACRHRQDGVDTLVVIARTATKPHRWFERRRTGGAVWTPWQPVDLDIETDTIVVHSSNGRLLLFWATVEGEGTVTLSLEEPADETTDTPADPSKATSATVSKATSAASGARQASNYGPQPLPEDNGHDLAATQDAADKAAAKEEDEATTESGPKTFVTAQLRLHASTREDAGWGSTRLAAATRTVVLPWGTGHDVGLEVRELDGTPELEVIPFNLDADVGIFRHSRRIRFHLVDGSLRPSGIPEGTLDPVRTANLAVSDGQRLVPGRSQSGSADDYFALMDIGRPLRVLRMPLGWSAAFDAAGLKTGGPAPGDPFFLRDLENSFVVQPEHPAPRPTRYGGARYSVDHIGHPQVHRIRTIASTDGLRRGLHRTTQSTVRMSPAASTYTRTTRSILNRTPEEELDFSVGSANGEYNWELFFYAPLTMAKRLQAARRYEEARSWFHLVYDPTATDDAAPDASWRFLPLWRFSRGRSALSLQSSQSALAAAQREYDAWLEDPLDPHRVARMRLVAYQKSVFMQYLDLLIEWADDRFRTATRESLEEALELYMSAAELLGDRPRTIPAVPGSHRSYANLRAAPSPGLLPSARPSYGSQTSLRAKSIAAILSSSYFCVPPNDRLLAYWDTIDDRLLKLRSAQDIDGRRLDPPLLAPPIDPALLVRANALGLRLDTILTPSAAHDLGVRFEILVGRAIALAEHARAFGQAILSAIERQDAAFLSELHAEHELTLGKELRAIQATRIKEAKAALRSLETAREAAAQRSHFYASREFLNAEESTELEKSSEASIFQNIASGYAHIGRALSLVPQVSSSATGPTASFGGSHLGGSVDAIGKYFEHFAVNAQQTAQRAGRMGGYARRADEWSFQKTQADNDVVRLDRDIVGQQIRIAIAELELARAERTLAQQRDVADHLTTRFTNEELYDWLADQTAALYYRSYDLALKLARSAESAYRFETRDTTRYIESDHWDGFHRGLTAADRLANDLRRLDTAFLENSPRELRLTKHISLQRVAPIAMNALNLGAGKIDFWLPEALFDADFPGHYMRRIERVALTIPVVGGSYETVQCTLRLLESWIRSADDPSATLEHLTPQGEEVVTSHAVNDAMIEPGDARETRRAPFERQGVISRWELELPPSANGFAPRELPDVVLHMTYRARPGQRLTAAATARAQGYAGGAPLDGASPPQLAAPGTGIALLSVRRDFPNEWAAYRATPPGADARLDLRVVPQLLEGRRSHRDTLAVVALRVLFAGATPSGPLPVVDIALPGESTAATATTSMDPTGVFAERSTTTRTPVDAGPIGVLVPATERARIAAQDIWLFVGFEVI